MLKLDSNKKAGLLELVMSPLFISILMIGILLILLWNIGNAFSKETYEALYLSNDMGLMLNSFYSLNGYAVIKYPNKLFNFSYDFSSKALLIYKQDSLANGPLSSFPLLEDKNIKFIPVKFDKADKLYLTKENKEIGVSKDKKEIKFPIICPKKPKISYDKVLILYPGRDEDPETNDFAEIVSRNFVSDKQISFQDKYHEGEYDLIIKITKDDKNVKRISVGYTNQAEELAHAACSLALNLISGLEYNNVEEINYQPEYPDIKNKKLISLKIGSYFIINKAIYASKTGDALYALLSAIN